MEKLVPLVAMMAAGNTRVLVKRTKRSALLYAIAAILLVTTYTALMVGLGIFLAGFLGGFISALLIAVTALVTALILLISLYFIRRAERVRQRELNSAIAAFVKTTATSTVPEFLKERPISSAIAIAALLIGIACVSGKTNSPK